MDFGREPLGSQTLVMRMGGGRN